MIKAAPAKAAAARTKPRPKKPATGKNDDTAAATADGESATGGVSGGATDAKQKPKRRRSAPKKKETDSDGAESHKDERALPLGLEFLQRAHDDQRYERAPRLLPDIAGVKALSSTEVHADIKHIQSALHAFEAKVSALLPPGATTLGKDPIPITTVAGMDDAADDERALLGFKPRRARSNGVITPEELVESLPACRRAVRITQRELAALKRERDDLERDFMRMRCKYVYHVRAMKTLAKQHDRVARVLGRDVVKIAKSLESSRRRTNALQDIMMELEARGNRIVRLTREKRQLEQLLAARDIPLPEIDAVYVGDRVQCALGVGVVVSMDPSARILTLEMDGGERAFVQEDDDVHVLAVETTYLDAERELKQSFFDKIGALVQPQGAGGGASARGRHAHTSSDLDAVVAAVGGATGALDDDSDDDEDDGDDSDDDEDNRDEEDESSSKHADSDADAAKQPKKRKLTMMPSTASSSASTSTGTKKRHKQQRVIEYPACTIPVTPYDTGLLLSPLSTLPDRVAAVGPNALQWKDSYLPSRMHEWEQERYDALQMKGEIERLRFQLQKAEAEKLDAQQHASDQLESINQLVTQLDKLRESASAAAALSHNSSASNAASCPHCHPGGSSNGSRKNSATSAKGPKASALKVVAKKDTTAKRLQSGENGGDNGSDEPDKKSTSESPDDESGDADAKSSSAHDGGEDDDDAGELSDGAASRPAARSLRPRRKPTSSSTTASPKQSK